MKGQKIINEQLAHIDKSITDFVDGLSASEQKVYDRVLRLLKELDVTSYGTVKNNAKNIIAVRRINNELKSIVINDGYKEKVSKFTEAFGQTAAINDVYFSTLVNNYSPAKVLKQITTLSIETTIADLTENGIGSAFTNGIRDILTTNVTTGASYSDMVNTMREHIIGKEGEEGTMVRYAKQIATDALNQYNGQYINATTDDLGFEWFTYVGSNIKTTRPFCLAMTEKRYYHISELPQIVKGDIDGKKVPLNGLIEGTNANNFYALRGGYNCGHQVYPALPAFVPKELRDKFSNMKVVDL